MIVTVAHMIRAERRAIEKLLIPSELLMYRAGLGVANLILSKFPTARRVGIASGFGNNGGDGFVAGLLLSDKIPKIDVVSLGQRTTFSRDARHFLDECNKRKNIRLTFPSDISEITSAVRQLRDSDVIIDALLGTGFRLPLKEPFITAIRSVSQGPPIVAVDIPSGLDGDTGNIAVECIRALDTVTFARAKVGMMNRKEYTGEITVVDIGIPDHCFEDDKW
jgi:NAD(P)H-hydrate epimerase